MLFSRYFLSFLLFFGLCALFSVPASAAEFDGFSDSITEAGKGKKGDAPPRPRPKPGPQEGDDDE